MSSDKKLCIATGIFPPDTGGPAKFAQSFAQWAENYDYPISIISLTDSDDSQTQLHGAEIDLISRKHRFILRFIKTVVLLRRRMRNHETILANGLFLEIYSAALTLKGARYFTKVPGDIVWERARNSGYTNLTIDDFQNQGLNLKFKIFRYLFTKSLKKSEAVIVPSKHIESLCVKWGLQKAKLILINNSVDTELFSPSGQAKKWDVVTVCRLVPWKGVEEILYACKKLLLSICVVGVGPELTNLKNLSKSLELNVTFAGELEQRDIIRVLDSSRCFVLNSSFEATSYALLEARSMGIFTIARKNTGSEEVIHHQEDGLLCDDANPLVDALKRFQSDKTFVSTAARAARMDTIERFDFKVNFSKIYKLVTG